MCLQIVCPKYPCVLGMGLNMECEGTQESVQVPPDVPYAHGAQDPLLFFTLGLSAFFSRVTPKPWHCLLCEPATDLREMKAMN